MNTLIPPWVQPGVYAVCDRTLFTICRIQQAKPPRREVVLCDAPKGGNRYTLSRCRLATLADLATCTQFIFEGQELGIALEQNQVRITGPKGSRLVRLAAESCNLAQAVASFAAAFDGEIIPDWEVGCA